MSGTKTDAVAKAVFIPKGKTFKQRLDAYIKDAKDNHKVQVGIESGGRTADKAQKWHIAHMFLFNAYKGKKPAVAAKIGDPIPWDHFSDASIVWKTVKWETFLRTKDGKTPVKDETGKNWKSGMEPDEEQTKKRAKAIVTADSVGPAGNRGSSMVAPGIEGCGEPCKCGYSRSKHISGKAADLKDLTTLRTKWAAAKTQVPLDAYLKQFRR